MKTYEPGYVRAGRRVQLRTREIVSVHCFVRDCGARIGDVCADGGAIFFPLPEGWHIVEGVAQPTQRLQRMERMGRGPDPKAHQRRMVRTQREVRQDPTALARLVQFALNDETPPTTSASGGNLPMEVRCPSCKRQQTIDAGRLGLFHSTA